MCSTSCFHKALIRWSLKFHQTTLAPLTTAAGLAAGCARSGYGMDALALPTRADTGRYSRIEAPTRPRARHT